MEKVILVDEHDVELGTVEKMEAHKRGLLHRAFSVLIFNSKGELLIQKRSETKYHSPSLWTNTCCSHPRPGESVIDAGRRRLKEEMGIETQLSLGHKFIYKVTFDNGLTEHELDYVLSGVYDGNPSVNPKEVIDWKFIPIEILKSEIADQPNTFTHWFKIIMSDWKQKAA